MAIHREAYTNTQLPLEFRHFANSSRLSHEVKELLVEAFDDYNGTIAHNEDRVRVKRMGHIDLFDVTRTIIGDLLDDHSIQGEEVWRELRSRLNHVTTHPLYKTIAGTDHVGATMADILAQTKQIVMYDGNNRTAASKNALRRIWDVAIPMAMAAVAEQQCAEEDEEEALDLEPAFEVEDWRAEWSEQLAS
ncbi:MAG: hypothetical protein FJ308_23810, partial [Planctomycetes bacterium]|nr:hypothetical protein [Planctomycetota bacterium]